MTTILLGASACGARVELPVPIDPNEDETGVSDTGEVDTGTPWRDTGAPDTGSYDYDTGSYDYDTGTWNWPETGIYDTGAWPQDTGWGWPDTGWGWPETGIYDTGVWDTNIVMPDVGVYPPPDTTGLTPFERIRTLMVGTWRGVRTNPWDSPAIVEIRFEANGHYVAKCIASNEPWGCSVWHNGNDIDAPDKRYEIFDMHADGTGEGRIFMGASFSGRWESLDFIKFDAAGTNLKFEFWYGGTAPGGYGPGKFDLTRIGP